MKWNSLFWAGICVRHERDARTSWGGGEGLPDSGTPDSTDTVPVKVEPDAEKSSVPLRSKNSGSL